MSTISLAKYHPIAHNDKHLILSSNGNVVACYRGILPEVYSLSEKDYDDIHSTWFQALKSLPAGCVVHKQDIYIKKAYTAQDLPRNTFLSNATHHYFKCREYIEHTCYLFFILTKNKAYNSTRYLNPFTNPVKTLPDNLKEEVVRFTSTISDSISYLNNSRKMAFSPLTQTEILDMTENHFNGYNLGLDTSAELDSTHVKIGSHYFDVLAVNSELCFGEGVQTCKPNAQYTSDDFVFHQGYIDGLGLSLNENHIVNQIIYLDDKHRWRKLLERKVVELNKSSNFGTQNKVTLTKIQDILSQINHDDTSRIIRGHMNVIFWDEKRERLKAIRSRIQTELKELDIVPYYPGSEERKNFILNSYCCYSSNFSNEDIYVTDLKHALCLYINNTSYRSDRIGIAFNDRNYNIPVLKDVWDANKTRIKARNFAIFAPTGEGKSFLANNILRQFFEMGVRLVIIDLGGSYTKFAHLYPKEHAILRYERGKNLGINPFYISDKDDVTPEFLEDLSVFLFELTSSESKVTKSQSVSLKKILKYYYKESEKGSYSLESFYGFVHEHQGNLLDLLGIAGSYFNIPNLLHLLSEYVGEGLYSFLFAIDQDQSYKIEDKRLIVFELDEVRDNKEILSVMLKLIKTAIQRTIWRNKEEKGIILFDEFAKQLKFPNVLESVEFYYQAIRKQEGAIGIILQSINQLPINATAASILENTQVIYSLHNEKGYKELEKRLNLSTHDRIQLKSIQNNLVGERKYTEIFIKIGKESNVYRLEVPPEVYAAYLTDGPENETIMALFKEYGSMETAISMFVERKSM